MFEGTQRLSHHLLTVIVFGTTAATLSLFYRLLKVCVCVCVYMYVCADLITHDVVNKEMPQQVNVAIAGCLYVLLGGGG